MVSGGSEAILNALCEEGVSAFENVNPFNSLRDLLMKPRYSVNIGAFATLVA
jgi:hypothetical protein